MRSRITSVVVGSVDGIAGVSLSSTYVGAGGEEVGDVYAMATDAFGGVTNRPAIHGADGCKRISIRFNLDRWKISRAGRRGLRGGTEFLIVSEA